MYRGAMSDEVKQIHVPFISWLIDLKAHFTFNFFHLNQYFDEVSLFKLQEDTIKLNASQLMHQTSD